MTACICTDCPAVSSLCICDSDASTVRYLQAARRAFLSEVNANRWLHTYNARLEGYPAELILLGAGPAVVEAARKVTAA